MKKLNCLVCDFSFMSLKYMNTDADLVCKLNIQTYFSGSSSYCSSTNVLYSFNIYCVLSNWCSVQIETLSFLKKPLAESVFRSQSRQVLTSFMGLFPGGLHSWECFSSPPSNFKSSGTFVSCSQQLLREPSLTVFYDKLLPAFITLKLHLWVLMLRS